VKTILMKKVIPVFIQKLIEQNQNPEGEAVNPSLIFLTTGLTCIWFRNINFLWE
jgi:hypothetical protein